MMKLKKKIPGPEFTVVIEPPFVVIGDEPPEEVRRRPQHTVRWAVTKLKAAYFTKEPAGDPRHLAVQGRRQLPQTLQEHLPRHARHALRVLLADGQGA